MAEIGIASSIIGIASTGIAVVSALTKFSISVRGANEKINFLAGRVSLTVSILEDIAATVRNHSSGFKTREFWKTWGSVLEACKECYGKIDKAVTKARGKSTGKDGEERKITVWAKLVWALGGEGEMRDLEASLERCCQQVMMMQQAVQLSVLSLIHQLTSDEAAERRELMGKLEWLLTGLSQNGNLVLPGKSPRDRLGVVIRDEPHWQPVPPIEVYSGTRVPPTHGPSGPRGGLFDPDTEGPPAAPPRLSILSSILPGRRPPSSPYQEPTSPLVEDSNKVRPVFEAFYILPRSLPRCQEKGEIQIEKPSSDDYMIICVDARGDYYKDKNVRDAIRRVKRGDAPPTDDEFPRAVRETATWLTYHRNKHNGPMEWNLVYGIKLQYIDEFFFRRTSSKSGFLVVLRGDQTSNIPEQLDSHRASSYSRSRSRSRADRTAYMEDLSEGESRSSQRRYADVVDDRRFEDYTYSSDNTKLGEIPQPPNSRSRSRFRSSAGDAERRKAELEREELREERARRRERRERREQRDQPPKFRYQDADVDEYGREPAREYLAPPTGNHGVSRPASSPARLDETDKRYSRSFDGVLRSGRPIVAEAVLCSAGVGAAAAAGIGSNRRARSEGEEYTRGSLPPSPVEKTAVSDDEEFYMTKSGRGVPAAMETMETMETKVQVSQQEAETMVMDFLATFADVKRDSF